MQINKQNPEKSSESFFLEFNKRAKFKKKKEKKKKKNKKRKKKRKWIPYFLTHRYS